MPATATIHHGTRCNAKTWANKFRARLLEPGLVSYEDQGCGKALLTKETIDNHIQSFVGRPLILSRNAAARPTYTHDEVSPENMEEKADGYITAVEYDAADGWWYALGIVFNEEAKQAIRDIGLVSCAYVPTGNGPGGEHHNIPYHEEITSFDGEHLAIVKNPRYEAATIRLNSKTKPKNTMFKWIQALSAAVTGAKKENSVPASGEIPADASLEIEGQQVPITDMVKAHARLNSKDGEEIDGTTEVQVGESRVTINDLLTCWNSKKNESDKEEKKDEEKKENELPEAFKKKDEDKKENASDEEKKDEDKKENASDEDEKKDEKKENDKLPRRFIVNSKAGILSAARQNGVTLETTGRAPDTMQAKLARGSERYGARTK
jgi:hypothetical protein